MSYEKDCECQTCAERKMLKYLARQEQDRQVPKKKGPNKKG